MNISKLPVLSLITILAVLMIFFSMLVFPGEARAEPGISIDVRDADIEDVLTMLAMKEDKNIIFVGDSREVSLQVDNVAVMEALELLLDKTGMTYIRDGELIIVGSEARLQEDFFNRISLTKYNLNHITTGQLEPLIGELGIPLQSFSMQDDETIWVQGTPRGLAKLRELLGAVDHPQYGEEEELKQVELDHINAPQLEQFMGEFGITLECIYMEEKPRTIWTQGTYRDFEELDELIEIVDSPEFAVEEEELKKFKLDYILAEQLEPLVLQLGITVQTFYMEDNPKTLWAQGTPHELDELEELKNTVDIKENKPEVEEDIKITYRQLELAHITPGRAVDKMAETGNPIDNYITLGNKLLVFDEELIENWNVIEEIITDIDNEDAREQHAFTYKFEHIMAQEAEGLLGSFGLDDVTIETFDFSEYGNELLVLCPPEMEDEVYRSLESIDSDREDIRVPIETDTGDNAKDRLDARRQLLSELSGIPEKNMMISDNISGDDTNPEHVLWVEETPGSIAKLEHLLGDI